MYSQKTSSVKLVNAPKWVGIFPSRLLASVFGKVGRASISERNQYHQQHRQYRENVWIRDVLTKIKIGQACQCSQLSWNVSSKTVYSCFLKCWKGINEWVESISWLMLDNKEKMYESDMHLQKSRKVKLVIAPNWVGIFPVRLLSPVFGKVEGASISVWKQNL